MKDAGGELKTRCAWQSSFELFITEIFFEHVIKIDVESMARRSWSGIS